MCLSLFSMLAFSQNDVGKFLQGGQADANKVIKAYMQPYAFALGDGLNNGWFSSAKTHSLFGFDLTVGVSGVQIPNSSKTFDLNSLHLTNMVVKTGGNIAPTVAGSKTAADPVIGVNDSHGNEIINFKSPQGTGLDLVPVPMVQIGFGLLPHTDLIGRFVPDIKYNNNGNNMKIGLWGIGAKHNFMEWIPVLNKLPFDASLFASYSVVNGESGLHLPTSDYSSNPNIRIETFNTDGQVLKLKTQSSKFGLIVSKKIAILTVFGAIGNSTSKSNVDLLGIYPVVATTSAGGFEVTQQGALKNPIALSYRTSNVSMEAGLRVKITLLSLFASISKSEYTAYNLGLSLGFR